MGIMKRIVNIFKADIHGVMDQLEDQDLLLKQHLRDMAEALNHKEAKLRQMRASQNQAQQDHDKYKQQCVTLEQDLTVAVQKNKDDLARMLIKKLKPLDNLRAELGCHIKVLDEEIAQFKDHLDQQRLRYEQLKHRSVEYFHKAKVNQWGKNRSELVPDGLYGEFTENDIEMELLSRKAALGT